ncbi:MAG: helix-turn-helix domain-containing protein [Planctomycetes bacterium]|nr:helix-turn-helix domain-containing protein [Planctomycetota bacterium]
MKIDSLLPTAEVLRELGRRLAHVRKQQGLSQEDLARAAGVGIATLRRLEDGKDGKLGSWLRLLMALGMAGAIEGLLPEELRSPLAEVRGQRGRRSAAAKAPIARAEEASSTGFVWGDEQR